ncbi:uncharacterized protein LOC114523710 isoform X2 [Dendronephthya gigantea]|uniref:uncharacterized protein LOC114523710 isoform X2 n=1 Tax=Dendronephthya gigantea TaxID=151771 RepID=UPI00106C2982|nr:uncharacterized protein LOC114523710 isoform X2 [Dendronephthya gigantea]
MASEEDSLFQNQAGVSWLGNIKEMARQLAALTRNTRNRHSPIAVKDSTYLGINHTLQTTTLTLNGQLNTPDFSAFKTPPEGHTPVDQNHFDYDDDTLKKFQITHNISLSLCDKQLNDSGIENVELMDVEHCSKHNNIEAIKTNDDDEPIKTNEDDAFEYHTPPTEFQDASVKDGSVVPPFGFPPKSDELINSVIELLSKTAEDYEATADVCPSGENEEISRDGNEEKSKENEELFEPKQNNHQVGKGPEVIPEKDGLDLDPDVKVNLERGSSEKDSLDGSPHSRRSFIQEEDDSGISMVDESDIVQEATMTNGHHFEAKKECKFQVENDKKDVNELLEGSHDDAQNKRTDTSTRAEKKTCNSEPESKDTKSNQNYGKLNEADGKYTRSNEEQEMKCKKSNSFENEQDSTVGWQTSHKRMSRKRQEKEYERMQYGNDNNCTENRVNPRETTSRRSSGKNKGRLEKSDEYSRTADKHSDDRGREKGAWTSKRGDENDFHESPKRSGRRGPLASRKSESKYAKNAGRERNGDKHTGKTESGAQNAKPAPSVFSYRDALLKVGSKVQSAKDPTQANSKTDKVFNFESAVSYLSAVWTSVDNLHKKDPSKVYIYNGE